MAKRDAPGGATPAPASGDPTPAAASGHPTPEAEPVAAPGSTVFVCPAEAGQVDHAQLTPAEREIELKPAMIIVVRPRLFRKELCKLFRQCIYNVVSMYMIYNGKLLRYVMCLILQWPYRHRELNYTSYCFISKI